MSQCVINSSYNTYTWFSCDSFCPPFCTYQSIAWYIYVPIAEGWICGCLTRESEGLAGDQVDGAAGGPRDLRGPPHHQHPLLRLNRVVVAFHQTRDCTWYMDMTRDCVCYIDMIHDYACHMDMTRDCAWYMDITRD